MKIEIDNLNFNMVIDEDQLKNNFTPLIFLHGFTGSAYDWQFLFDRIPEGYLPISIDLIGHGESSRPGDENSYTTESQIAQLKGIIEYLNFSKVAICGYSMGGRLALSFAVKHPAMVDRLILESSSPGLKEQSEKVERLESDSQLADRIEKGGVDKFIDYWMHIPLFATLENLPAGKFQEIVRLKKENDPVGLANSLRGFSTGRMPQLWDELKNLHHEILLITGAMDEKFNSINEKAAQLLQNAEHFEIHGCGHNAHLENPEDFIILVNQFLNK